MKILFATTEYPPAPHGGIGSFLETLAAALVGKGHRVWVVTLDPQGKGTRWVEDRGVTVLRVGSHKQNVAGALFDRARLCRAVGRLARRVRPDLLETHDWSGPLPRAPWRPLIVRMHGAHTARELELGRRPSRFWRVLERRTLALADARAAVSDWIGRRTLTALGLEESGFETIYNAVDTRLFAPRGGERSAGEVLYVGAVRDEKGLPQLFDAMARVFGGRDGTLLTLAGRAAPGEAERLLARLPVEFRTRVRFLGQVRREELPQLYSRAAVSVFPALSEAFGIATVEAMASQAPVVVSSRGAGAEVVENGVSGLLVDPLDGDALSRAILSLLSSPSLARRLGVAARERVLERFDIDGAVERNLEFYRRTIEAKRQARMPCEKGAARYALTVGNIGVSGGKRRLAVCIPTYRRPALLEALIADLAAQTRLADRLIIVDGDPDSGAVRRIAERAPFPTVYVPSTRANLPFQRCLGWRCRGDCETLVYLDDDIRIPDRLGLERLVAPLEDPGARIAAVTAPIYGLEPRRPHPLAALLGSARRTPAGEMTPSGERILPLDRGSDYAPVGWLYGCVMGFRASALNAECFPVELLALTEHGWGRGEESVLALRVRRAGGLLLALRARFEHFEHGGADATSASSSEPEQSGYGLAVSRRLINDSLGGERGPSLAERAALARSLLGGAGLALARAARGGAAERRYAWGYVRGAARGLLSSPSARRLTPLIDWPDEMERALAGAIELDRAAQARAG